MSVEAILREIEALPSEGRWSVVEGVRRLVELEVPASFRDGIEQIERGEGIELGDALGELDEGYHPVTTPGPHRDRTVSSPSYL